MAADERASLYTYLVVSRGSPPPQVVLWDTARIRIGRHHEQDIVLDDPEVSRQHALLRRDGDTYNVEDLGTSNGTLVNAEPVRSVELRPDDVIRIGACSVQFCQSPDDPRATLPRVIPASRLRSFQPLPDDASGSTMLGLPTDGDALWSAAPRPAGSPTPQPVVRDLDDELGLSEKDDPPDVDGPEDPDPLMASGFDLGPPLPPVGAAPAPAPGAPARDGAMSGAITAPRFVERDAAPGASGASIEVTLQLDGVDPNLLRLLQSLLGQRLDLSALSVLLKALSTR